MMFNNLRFKQRIRWPKAPLLKDINNNLIPIEFIMVELQYDLPDKMSTICPEPLALQERERRMLDTLDHAAQLVLTPVRGMF